MRKMNSFSAAALFQMISVYLDLEQIRSYVRWTVVCHYGIQIWSGGRLENLLQFFGPPSPPHLCLALFFFCCCCCCCCIVALFCALWDLRAGLPSHGLYTLSQLSQTFTCTHTQWCAHTLVLYLFMLSNAVQRAHMLIQTPVHSSVAHSPRPASSVKLYIAPHSQTPLSASTLLHNGTFPAY